MYREGGRMGVFDTIVDAQGHSYQTKWIPLRGSGILGPVMNHFRVGDEVACLDGDYDAVSEADGSRMVVAVRHHRIASVHGLDKVGDGDLTNESDPVVRLLQDLYSNDVLFVKLSSDERRVYDERLRSALDMLGVDYDGKRDGPNRAGGRRMLPD